MYAAVELSVEGPVGWWLIRCAQTHSVARNLFKLYAHVAPCVLLLLVSCAAHHTMYVRLSAPSQDKWYSADADMFMWHGRGSALTHQHHN